MKRIAGRAAVVTGAGSGTGRAICVHPGAVATNFLEAARMEPAHKKKISREIASVRFFASIHE